MENLIACPTCDKLYELPALSVGQRARCTRCHHVIAAAQTDSLDRTLASALAVAILILFAAFFPFISISRLGLSNSASLIDIALAFSHGWSLPLTIAVAAAIIVIPLVRVGLLLYALLPLIWSDRPLKGATSAFRTSEALLPWSMAEIFVIGTAVALVKVAGLAHLEFGPAFWAFCAAVFILAFERPMTDRVAIWRRLDRSKW